MTALLFWPKLPSWQKQLHNSDFRPRHGMAKVIISSTGLDLQEYRDAAIEICLKLQLLPIAMEYFEVMGAGATEGSKRKLAEADAYVGIFAHRYGYIESGYDKSVTEIEFDYAGKR